MSSASTLPSSTVSTSDSGVTTTDTGTDLPRALVGNYHRPAIAGSEFSRGYGLSYESGRIVAVTSSGLPAGITMLDYGNAINFVGTPTTVGDYDVTISLTGIDGTSGKLVNNTQTVPLTVMAPATVIQPAAASMGQPFQHQLLAFDGGQVVSVEASGLPAGLAVSPNGMLSGTPNVADNVWHSKSYSVSMKVGIRPAGQPSYMQYVIYSSHHVNIEVVDPAIQRFTLVDQSLGYMQGVSIPAFSCPAEAPWLLNHQWDKWRKVFPGIAVTEPGGIGVSMTAAEQFDGNGRATGWGTDWTNSATNWGSVNTVTITADCTSDPNRAAVR